jgi:hypothetical protein
MLSRLLLIVVLGAGIVATSDGQGRPSFICRRAPSAIRIDGKLDDAAWSKADLIHYTALDGKQPQSTTEARVLWDDRYLYVAFRAYDKDVWSVLKDRDATTCQEDCLECFLMPDPPQGPYYNFEINALGTIYDAYNLSRNSGGFDHHRWARWNCKGVSVAITVEGTLNDPNDTDTCWQMELAIPLAELPSLQGGKPKVGDRWLFLLARYDFSVYLADGAELSACVPLKVVDFHASDQWPELRFAE